MMPKDSHSVPICYSLSLRWAVKGVSNMAGREGERTAGAYRTHSNPRLLTTSKTGANGSSSNLGTIDDGNRSRAPAPSQKANYTTTANVPSQRCTLMREALASAHAWLRLLLHPGRMQVGHEPAVCSDPALVSQANMQITTCLVLGNRPSAWRFRGTKYGIIRKQYIHTKEGRLVN